MKRADLFVRLGVSEGDLARAAGPLAFNALVVAAVFILKPAREAQFLSRVGAASLPYVYMASGLAVAAAAAVLGRVARGAPIGRVVSRATAGACAASLALWAVQSAGPGLWFDWVFYLWVVLLGAMLPLLGWHLWHQLFTVREARRSLWLVVLGGTLGALWGGLASVAVATGLGPAGLIPAAAAHLFAGFLVLRRLRAAFPEPWRRESPSLLQTPTRRSSWRLLRESRPLLFVMAAILLMEFSSTWIEYLFQTAVSARFDSARSMTRFLGWFYAGQNLVEIVFQVSLSRVLIQRGGLRLALAVLPAALGGLSVGLPLFPGLLAAAVLRGTDGLLRHSVAKSAVELLLLPFPKELKTAARGPLEAVAQRCGAALAGAAILLFLGAQPGAGPWRLAPLWLALLALFVLGGLLHREYLELLKSAFRSPPQDRSGPQPVVVDLDLKKRLSQALSSPDETEVLNALEFVEALDLRDLLWPHFARHPSARVRMKTLRLSPFWAAGQIRLVAEPLLRDAEPAVRAEAVRVACALEPREAARLVSPHLASPDPVVRAQAAACLARGRGENAERAWRVLEAMCRSSDPADRREAAGVLGGAGEGAAAALLGALLKDADDAVALRAAVSAGERKDPVLWPPLLSSLSRPAVRAAAEQALAAQGEALLGALGAALEDAGLELSARRRIPVILGRMECAQAASSLTGILVSPDAALRYAAVKALNRARRHGAGPSLDEETVAKALLVEAECHRRLLEDEAALEVGRAPGPAAALLLVHLRDRMEWAVERVFRLLGLLYRQADIHRAYLGWTAGSPGLRSQSVEFIDNIVRGPLRASVLSVLEPAAPGPSVREARGVLDGLRQGADQTAAVLAQEALHALDGR